MIVGTAGHIDHGKTSLVRALTGVDADRLKEEKARGITIDLGFAYLPVGENRVIGFVDVPGHEKLVRNMVAGAAGIDFVMLVIAADDGIMPQTREHLAIVSLLGVSRGLVALTKTDLVDADRLAVVEAEIAATLAGTPLEGCAIVPVSSATGAGIPELRMRLEQAAEETVGKSGEARFRLAVDRSFIIQGAGTVVTGTVLSGAVSVGDRVVISPSGLEARVRGLHAQNRESETGRIGDRCALNIAGERIAKDAVSRGDVVLDPALHAPTDRIDAKLSVLASEKRAVTQWMPVHLHHGARDVPARVVLLSDAPIAPGGEGFVQLVLDAPIAAAAQDRFVLRDTSAQRTIGGGVFLDLRAPTRKRRGPERLAQLGAQAIADPREALIALLETPPHFVDIDVFARDRALSPEHLHRILKDGRIQQIAGSKSSLAIPADMLPVMKRSLVAMLEQHHADNPDLAGIGIERLRLRLTPRLPAPAFAALLQSCQREGVLALDGAWVKLPSHEVRLTPEDEALWRNVEPMIGGEQRFRPPRVRDIANLLGVAEPDMRRLFKLLSRMGRVDEVDHDHFFQRRTVAEMVEVARDLSDKGENRQFTAAAFRDRLQNGRKVAIGILEFFDKHGVTIRRGDLRRINPHRLNLFSRGDADDIVKEIGTSGRDSSPVGRPDFKSGRGRETAFGGFDSHSLPPHSLRKARAR